MTTAIQYARPASGQTDSEIFGLDVAVTNFLSAYFRHATQTQFICRPADMPSFDHFKSLATSEGHNADEKCVGIDPRYPKLNLESISCLFRPDPLIADLIWRRQQLAGRGYAACGLVHTMSGDRIAHAVGELCTAPSEPGDALICPSEAVQKAVHNLWEIQTDYLNHRFGGKFKCPVQTQIIPLGIRTETLIQKSSPGKRALQRQRLGIADDEIAILFHGRLSFASKAHPLPLFMAMERAALQTKRKLRLVMYGYYKPADMEPHFRNLATDICKNTRVDFIMNNDTRFPDAFWAGADIFVSLADNVQESFGLTPLEAMAANLPAIITDWNGYRGGVRDNIDGFLIPTISPPVSAGMAIAERYYNFGNYGIALMGASQSTAIDITRCADAIAALANNDEKRHAMGASGRARALDTYDWRHIIPRYENLWREQAAERQSAQPYPALPPNWQAAHPDFPNPYKMFESFPSRQLTPNDAIQITLDNPGIEYLMKHEMNYFIDELLIPQSMMLQLIAAIRAAGSPRAQDILAPFPEPEHARLWRCLGWMLKHGVAVTT